MRKEILQVDLNRSAIAEVLNLIVTLKTVYSKAAIVAIGYPGLPNITGRMEPGDAILFETPTSGMLEARMLTLHSASEQAEFLITEVSPRLGLLAGAAEIDPANGPFTDEQLSQVAASIKEAQRELVTSKSLLPEQIELLNRKLDEIKAASGRMGRKDWVNYAAGSLTSICISAAFAPDVTRSVFLAVNNAFAWLFTSGILLLSTASA